MISRTPWIQQFIAAPLSERSSLLEACVESEFRAWLQMSESDALPRDESYFALGLTSLGAVEIQQRLEAILGCRIDSTSLFNNPTVGHLVTYLRSEALSEFFISVSVTRNSSVARRDDAATVSAVSDESPSPKQLFNDLLDDLYES